MMTSKLGRGFEDLPIEAQVKALRDRAIGQELLIRVLLEAARQLGVTFTADGEPVGPAEDDA